MTSRHRLPLIFLLACTAACTAPEGADDQVQASPATVPSDQSDAAMPTAKEGAGALAGDSFRARGNEPFWAIDTEGDTLHFVTPEMPEGRTLESERIAHVKGVAFSGEDDGRPFSLDITRTDCTDSMSGEAFEFTATWDYAGQRMHGCARSNP